jgi:hypothetical protein
MTELNTDFELRLAEMNARLQGGEDSALSVLQVNKNQILAAAIKENIDQIVVDSHG